MGEEKTFGVLRTLLWPVHRSEMKKVLSMLFLLFLLCIAYSVLRNLKDTIVLTAKHSGAEAIPFLKVWGMLPGAIIATFCYTRLARVFTREVVFYCIITGFVAYYLLFAFVIHPHSEQLHLHTLGDWLSLHLPEGCRGLISLVRNWTFTTFYVVSELWSTVVLGILFWGFANDTTGVAEAKRTYGILNIGSNIAPVLGGVAGLLCGASLSLGSEAQSWSQTLEKTSLMIACLGFAAMALFYWINRRVLPQKKEETPSSQEVLPKKKTRISVRDSIRYISKSKYLTCLAILVLGFNISINFTDILWKEQLKRFFTDPNAMYLHMQKVTMGIGIIGTVGGALFSLMVNRLGWTFTAILTPMIMTVMAIGFFVFLFFGDALTALTSAVVGASPLMLTVYFGSLQNCLSKAGKYSLFDATKELAFLPLDSDARLQGKAAIDGLGSSLGKSGSSITYQGMLVFLGSLTASTPYICAILFVVLTAWISSVFTLGGLFKKASQPREEMSTNPEVVSS
ncbi:MAG: NTP/NDP exchange transporter [Chlamydiae bacterium]|nr:NTP/NDP exchange transporter [Chlamydiota bacterium]